MMSRLVPLLVSALPVILLAAVAAGVVYRAGPQLLPPERLVIAAGREGGGYHATAELYGYRLARDGIELEILETAGSVENAARLAAGEADAALLQGGIEVDPESDLQTLAAVFHEPLFIFVREADGVPANPGAWSGLALAAGPAGSGARAAAEALVEAAELPPRAVALRPLAGEDAVAALVDGEVDAALFVTKLSTPILEPLFRNPALQLLTLDPLEVVSRRMPGAAPITLPKGAISIAPPLPAADVGMVSMVARLVARADLHPALEDRLVSAAMHLHARRDALTERGRFPAAEPDDGPPMSRYAAGLIQDGPSQVREWLPWWAAAQIDRVLLLLLPIVILSIPLLRAAPGLYAWRMRRRVWRRYEDIRRLDAEAQDAPDRAALQALAGRVERLDEELARLDLPLAYRENAYTARLHLDLLRHRLAERLR